MFQTVAILQCVAMCMVSSLICLIYSRYGLPSEENPYSFNGDFVDRGSFSLEVILTLFAFRCLYPRAMYLARGNHESKSMNKIYGFEGEVKFKLSDTFVELFAEVFCCLPLAHVTNNKVFVVHGGLFSVDGVKLSDIRAIDCFSEPPEEGLMCETLWSDPQPQLGRGPSKQGVGLSFGADVTKRFLQENNLELVRSHKVKDEGYEIEHDGKLITVFSAPNYCDQMGNKGAFIRFTAPELKPDIVTFSAVPHPNVKPMAYANNFVPPIAANSGSAAQSLYAKFCLHQAHLVMAMRNDMKPASWDLVAAACRRLEQVVQECFTQAYGWQSRLRINL